ncbi:MAG TPA: histidine phosphatase family protein [Lachnospiraceae bacterium]|nr:histidine phosphatase family protein [Lachnospiraceae bacterium]
MLRLYLIRHSMTEGNQRRCYIGRTDEPLCKEGITLLQERSYPEVEVVFTSPLLRCQETADYLYQKQDRIIIDQLQECNFGEFEGRNYEELKAEPEYIRWLASNGKIPFPGGEDPMEFRKRCVNGFDEVVAQCIDTEIQQAALIIHGGTIMAILERYARPGKDFYHWQVGNGEGYVVTLDEESWSNDPYITVFDRI